MLDYGIAAGVEAAMRQTGTTMSDRAPLGARIAIWGTLALIVGGAVALAVINGPAILLDLAASAAAFVCL